MTIQLNLQKHTMLEDMKVIQQISNAGKPELVEPMGKFLKINNISTTPFEKDNIIVNVSLDDYMLLCLFENRLV